LGYTKDAGSRTSRSPAQPLSDTMLSSVYTLWSKVLTNDDFVAMLSPDKKAKR
jgi:hypothetical protein